jgi:hypothetical protein
MNEDQVLAYVQAAAALLQLPLDATRAQAVALQLSRTQELARMLEGFPMEVHDEICELYCPSPFPLSAEERRRSGT